MRANDRRVMLDPGLTALALRGLTRPSSYPFVERHLWRRRAAGLCAGMMATLRGRARTPRGMATLTPGTRS
jgi:hypothetical protein